MPDVSDREARSSEHRKRERHDHIDAGAFDRQTMSEQARRAIGHGIGRSEGFSKTIESHGASSAVNSSSARRPGRMGLRSGRKTADRHVSRGDARRGQGECCPARIRAELSHFGSRNCPYSVGVFRTTHFGLDSFQACSDTCPSQRSAIEQTRRRWPVKGRPQTAHRPGLWRRTYVSRRVIGSGSMWRDRHRGTRALAGQRGVDTGTLTHQAGPDAHRAHGRGPLCAALRLKRTRWSRIG